MRKKILIISPKATHPQFHGNQVRIFNLVLHLRALGFDVHYLFIKEKMEQGDENKMHEIFGDRYHVIDYRFPPRSFLRRILRHLKKIFKWELYFLDDWFYSIDDWYDPALDQKIPHVLGELTFDAVIVEYVTFSKALNLFDKDVIKIIDTHDVFANRHKRLQKHSRGYQLYDWFTATIHGEAEGLNRSDVIIAIQEDEKKYFDGIVDKKVITVGPVFTIHPPQEYSSKTTQKLLYVGGDGQDNRQGILYFLENIFPELRARFPSLKLELVGQICDNINEFDGCIKRGFLDDLGKVYAEADVVINPSYSGTGLSIKTVEALSFARPLVCSLIGARGLEHGWNKAFIVANSRESFGHSVAKVLQDRELQRTLPYEAHQFALEYNHRIMNELGQLLNYSAASDRVLKSPN